MLQLSYVYIYIHDDVSKALCAPPMWLKTKEVEWQTDSEP